MRPFASETCSDTRLRLVTQWIKNCKEHHEPCERPCVTSFPKRILETAAEKLYLRTDLGASANYACLSHCWGSKGTSGQIDDGNHSFLGSGICDIRATQDLLRCRESVSTTQDNLTLELMLCVSHYTEASKQDTNLVGVGIVQDSKED